jgi:hypothetical protein
MSRIGWVLVFAASVAACAPTSGREWLSSPIDERAVPTHFEVAPPVTQAEARPRLSHTVTLGQTYADSAPRREVAAPSAPTVQVNVPVTVNHYTGYGYGYTGFSNTAYGRGSTSGATSPTVGRSSTPSAAHSVGGNWPAIPDYGPKAMR